MTFRTKTILTSLALSLFCAQACGGEDGKKKALAPEAGPDAGMDADAEAEPEDSSVGPDAQPDVQDEPEPDAGPDAGPDAEADADAEAGTPPPPLELLFTVNPAALGITGTAVADEPNPASAIFTSKTGAPAPIDGTNQKLFDAAVLGILASDEIDAFTFLKPAPADPLYLFSIDGSEGGGGAYTRVESSTLAGEPSGDVYFSDGTLSHRDLGEGGDQYGYNGLLADESSLGLANPDPEFGETDNLQGLYVRGTGENLTEVYFSVRPTSVGPSGSALFDLPVEERGCTIFRSALDGTHSIAFGCAQLGLLPDSDVDALAVLGDGAPSQVIFSLEVFSSNLQGAELFQSIGDDTNSILATSVELGLDDWDEIDGLAVIDRALPSYLYDDTCTLTDDPISGSGELTAHSSSIGIGSNTIVLHGPNAGGTEGLAAYNAQTCAFVGRVDLPSASVGGSNWATVPLANWSEAMPFSNVEHWSIAKNTNFELVRRDAQGALVDTYQLELGVADSFSPMRLVYEPTNSRFFVTMDPGSGPFNVSVLVVDRPAPGAPEATPLSYSFAPLPHPCASDPQVVGPDGLGNVIFSQRLDGDINVPRPASFRVCWVSPGLEFALPPVTWTPEIDMDSANLAHGIMTPTSAYVMYQEFVDGGVGPFQIERAVFAPPPPQ